MKALVKEVAGPGFTMRDVPIPEIRDDEVLIRVRRAGVCGTDVHIYDWDDWAKGRCRPPFTVGHEFSGDVVSVGKLVTDVHEGDRVTAEGHIVDGRCLLCRTGNSHVCPHTKIIGVDRDGCFAEYIAMPSTNVWHLDDSTPYEVGGIMDPMGNAFHTALTAEIPGAVVLITGCGPIGIFAVGICKAAGASRIIASDVNETRLALAKQMGAHDVVHPSEAEAAVKRATDGLGADVVLEMSGVPSAIHQAFALVRVGGRVCKAAGASRIIASDVNETRLALAKQMGAHDVVHPSEAEAAVKRATDGLGADVVLEMSGVPSAIHQAFALVRVGGRVQMLGIPAKPMEVNFATEVIFKGITIYGVVGRRMYDTWIQMTRFLRSGAFDPTPVITHRFPLAEFDQAIAAIKSGHAGKVIFEIAD